MKNVCFIIAIPTLYTGFQDWEKLQSNSGLGKDHRCSSIFSQSFSGAASESAVDSSCGCDWATSAHGTSKVVGEDLKRNIESTRLPLHDSCDLTHAHEKHNYIAYIKVHEIVNLFLLEAKNESA